MFNPIAWLFDTSHFITRDHCGLGWTAELKSAYIFGNIAIAFAYFSIPVALVVLYRSKRQELPSSWMIALFATFILLCGLTHVSDVLVFHWAPYRFYTFLFDLTGVVSIAAAFTLPWVVRKVAMMPTREFVHKLNGELNKKVLEIEMMNRDIAAERDAVIRELDAARNDLKTQRWKHGGEVALDLLDARIGNITAILTPSGTFHGS